MISYRSPEFAGFQVHAQYAFGSSDTAKNEYEGKTTDRYYAIGATYTNGGLNLIGIVDSINESTRPVRKILMTRFVLRWVVRMTSVLSSPICRLPTSRTLA